MIIGRTSPFGKLVKAQGRSLLEWARDRYSGHYYLLFINGLVKTNQTPRPLFANDVRKASSFGQDNLSRDTV